MSIRILVAAIAMLLIVTGCSEAEGVTAPTSVECQVLSWIDPVVVSFPLDSYEPVSDSVDIEGLLLVEFHYSHLGLSVNTIDTSGGERNYISTSTGLTSGERVDLESVGQVVVDSTYTHPTNRQQYRIRCTAE